MSRKIWSFVTLLIVASLLLTACGGAAATPPPAQSTVETKATEAPKVEEPKATEAPNDSFLMRRFSVDDKEQVQKVLDGLTLSLISYCYHRHPRGENVHEVMEHALPLRVPLVVGPRYKPAPVAQSVVPSSGLSHSARYSPAGSSISSLFRSRPLRK